MKRIIPQATLILTFLIVIASVSSIQSVSDEGSWIWIRNTVTGDYGEALVGAGSALYIARGVKLYRYTPSVGSWAEMAPPPNPDSGDAFKTGTALAWDFGDYIYALYGAATSDSRRWFYRYSISSNSWQALANTTTDQGEGDTIAWVSSQNCLYATIGGEQRPTRFMRYDPSSNSWSDAPSDPPAGTGDGASLVWTGGDHLYALRGEFHEDSALYDFWRYSLTDDAWTAVADIPALSHSGGVGGVGDGGSLLYVGFWLPSSADYIYALSGNQAYPDGIPDNRTYRYTISTNSWERLADMPFGVGYYVGCRLGYADNHIYAWQGAPSTWTGGGDDLARYEFPVTDTDPPATTHNYDGAWHKTDFSIILTATDDVSGVNQTYYRINNGSIRAVSMNGHPFISTEGSNNTLEYWSVDNAGNPESPHKVLTGIKLDKSPPTIEQPSRAPEGDVHSNQEVRVSANIIDATSTVKNATLQYSLNDTDLWTSLTMEPNSTSGYYEATIPGQQEGSTIRFKIRAYDYAGNNITRNGVDTICVYTVIPEFPPATILAVLMALTMLAAALARKNRTKRFD